MLWIRRGGTLRCLCEAAFLSTLLLNVQSCFCDQTPFHLPSDLGGQSKNHRLNRGRSPRAAVPANPHLSSFAESGRSVYRTFSLGSPAHRFENHLCCVSRPKWAFTALLLLFFRERQRSLHLWAGFSSSFTGLEVSEVSEGYTWSTSDRLQAAGTSRAGGECNEKAAVSHRHHWRLCWPWRTVLGCEMGKGENMTWLSGPQPSLQNCELESAFLIIEGIRSVEAIRRYVGLHHAVFMTLLWSV